MKYILIINLIVFFSCNNNTMKKKLSILTSQSINLPVKAKVTYNGIDTVMNDMFESELKLIAYTDSTGCLSCRINKMNMWIPFLKYAEMYDGRLKFYFIYHPTLDIRILRDAMMLNPIDYPVIIDEKGSFEKLNPHLPKDEIFHTFLLDENNNVILVGNPLYNKEIEKLFYKKTQELLTK